MTASLSTPWGKFPLPLPGGTTIRFFLRIAGPCVAEASAPEAGSSSRLTSGAGQSVGLPADYFTAEGDLIAVPPYERGGANLFCSSVSARACVAAREGGLPAALSRAPP